MFHDPSKPLPPPRLSLVPPGPDGTLPTGSSQVSNAPRTRKVGFRSVTGVRQTSLTRTRARTSRVGRFDQREDLVRSGWHGARADDQGTQAVDPDVRRDSGAPHEGASRSPAVPPRAHASRPARPRQPENRHVKFNVDVKVYNDPPRLFALMHKAIAAHPEWETLLAPRIILGLWHPRFIVHAKKHMPYCRRSYIGGSTDIARKYFWEHCDAFSMWFPSLSTLDGER